MESLRELTLKVVSREIPVEHIKEKLEILHNLHHNIVCKLNILSISQAKIPEMPKPIPVLVRDWEFGFPGPRCHISRS